MGYKLAGFDVLGFCELDKKMAQLYQRNHHPRFAYVMDVRDLLKQELPEEFYNLDILDGSPPCSVFSIAGGREKNWNKEKKFKEGQKKQRLDDLFFYFLDIAKELRPKVIVAENVKGLILGNARGYVNEIMKKFSACGYDAQLFLLNAAKMGVPQARERVFFIARRKDLKLPKIKFYFSESVITFGDVRTKKGKPAAGQAAELLRYRRKGDRDLSDINKRVTKKTSMYTSQIFYDDEPARTVTAGGYMARFCDGMLLSDQDISNIQTFPQDYDFCGMDVQYVCGMSVPPVMMANVAREVDAQLLSLC